jgi:mono/diheme cytochrome c family protein
MPRSALLGLLVTGLALVAAGCGSGSATSTTTGSPSAAETLFVRNCASCHRLAAADASGSVGADLDQARPSESAVLTAIAEGPGDMPSALLQGADAQKVARYVARVAGQRR